jgi:hypothetical protein
LFHSSTDSPISRSVEPASNVTEAGNPRQCWHNSACQSASTKCTDSDLSSN